MKPFGCVKRIDDSGRLNIPKEMRETLNLEPGMQLEIKVSNNAIIMKRYDAAIHFSEEFKAAVKALARCDIPCAVYNLDLEKVYGGEGFKNKYMSVMELQACPSVVIPDEASLPTAYLVFKNNSDLERIEVLPVIAMLLALINQGGVTQCVNSNQH